ncbi:MAG: class I SAM-dependent methyltransferase [Opitutaceae bacterium]
MQSSHSTPAFESIARHCCCCDSNATAWLGRKRGEFVPREFDFFACTDCGWRFVEPFTGYEIYDDAYYRGQGPDPYVDYAAEYRDWRTTDRGLEFADLARIAATYLSAGERGKEKGEGRGAGPAPSSLFPFPDEQRPLSWLDFGCGAGGLLKFLRERRELSGRPLELTGHDVGSYANLLRSADGFRILDLATLEREPASRFDIISMIEVIEHLPNPAAPLALASRLLKPGGMLLLTTGNLDSPVARRRGLRYRYCAPEIHVSLFNPRCLAQLYRRVGLRPHPVRYRGAVAFKVVKTLRRHPALRALARVALRFPPFVWLIDRAYGVSAMPCAVKPDPASAPR